MRVICHTNLDLPIAERWPDDLDFLPRVGDEIMSAHKWGVFQLSLEVYKIRFAPEVNHKMEVFRYGRWMPHIELHMTAIQRMRPSTSGRGQPGSIIAFYEWYAPLVGRSVSSFIDGTITNFLSHEDSTNVGRNSHGG